MRVRRLIVVLPFAFLICGPAVVRAAALFQSGQHSLKYGSTDRQACPGTQDVDAFLSATSSLLEQGRFTDALTTLQSNLPPHCDYRISLLYAAAFEGSGHIANAERVLLQALALWPSNSSIATSLARYYLRDGDIAKAANAIAQCKPNSSTPIRELQMMAVVDLESQNLSRAKSVALLAYQRYPSEETLLFYANVLQLQGRCIDVVALLQKQRSAYSDSAPFLITIAESEYDGKMYASAHQDLEKAITLNSQSYAAHYLLGNVLVKSGDLDGGIGEYQNAIQLSPQQPRTYYYLGVAFEQKLRDAEAEKEFERSLSVDDRYAPAYCELGKLELRAGQLHDAVENLNRAIEYNPSLPESYFLLVQTYARLGQRDKSQSVMHRWTAYKNSHRLRVVGVNQDDLSTDLPAKSGQKMLSSPQ